MNKKMIVIASGILALVVFLLGVFFYTQQQGQKTSQLAQDNSAALIRPHSPTHGNPNAKVTIVEFLDPACETCSAFYPIVKGLVNANFGQVNLVVRYAPFHKGSDEVVKILEAARMQNIYWSVLEVVLKSQSVWASHAGPQPGLVWDLIKETGIDIAKAKVDVNDPSIANIIEQDLADARALNVTKTPGFFVNGKPLANFGAEQLKAMVADALRSAP